MTAMEIPPPDARYPHIDYDVRGRPTVGDFRIRISMLIDLVEGTEVPWEKSILETYPNLRPAQVHAALAYYYDHQQTIDAYRQSEAREVEEVRVRFWNAAVQDRLAEDRRNADAAKALASKSA